jgi:very-short-patch-repair endonuclease
VAFAELEALGYGRHRIHHRARTGRLHRIHRGVYAVGHTNLSLRGRWMAAVLACGPGAVLSHRHAATLHDLLSVSSGWITVTATSGHRIPGVRCRRTGSLHPDDVTAIHGIPVTSLDRTYLDLAETGTPRQLRSALEQGERENKLDYGMIDPLTARCPGRRGLKPLADALADMNPDEPWTQSELERAFLELTRAAGLPQPQMNVYVLGELVDCYWPAERLVVQIDGWKFHRGKRSFESDRALDALLVEHHVRVVRYTHRRVRYESAAVAAQLTNLLRGSGAPSPPPVRSGP